MIVLEESICFSGSVVMRPDAGGFFIGQAGKHLGTCVFDILTFAFKKTNAYYAICICINMNICISRRQKYFKHNLQLRFAYHMILHQNESTKNFFSHFGSLKETK